jgi:ATP-dependent RNA helicase DDX23/PRP28
MDFIISDEVSSEVTKLDKIKKENNDKTTLSNKPVFLTKEEREKRLKEELLKKMEEEKEREKKIQEIKSQYLKANNDSSKGKRDRSRSRQRSRSRSSSRDRKKRHDRKHKRSSSSERSPRRKASKEKIRNEEPLENIKEEEVQAIKSKYLGLKKEKRRLIKPSEKFKTVFNFEWNNAEDTSRDINPLYDKKIEPQFMFGRGNRGGLDKYDKYLDDKRYKYKSVEGKREDKDDNKHWSKKNLYQMSDRDWRIFREDHEIIIKGGRVPHPFRTWEESKLPDYLMEAIKDIGYKTPSAIQMQAIPIGLERRDLIGLAPTGSGKSAAFLIPLIAYLSSLPSVDSKEINDGPYAMILAPSRELAIQIHEEFIKFAKHTKLKSACLIGGRSGEEQAMILGVGVEVIIGTPGRIRDALERSYTVLNQCYYVVLDEADTMIKEGFEETLNYILECIPPTNLKSADEELIEEQEKESRLGGKNYRITMMFSATMTTTLERLARKYLRCPSYVTIGEPGIGKKTITQKVEYLKEGAKKDRLRTILDRARPPIIIFVNQKITVDYLTRYLEKYRHSVTSLHSGKSQEGREKALNSFKDGRYDILVATNVAAKGIDVEGLELVINYDAPTSIDDYTHRIGRTGRAGKKGTAITFLTDADEGIFYDLKQYLEMNDQIVPDELSSHPASKFKQGNVNDKMPRRKQIVYTN